MIGIDVMRLSRPTPSPTVEVTPEQEPPRAEGEQEASA
jgi:hypothetical protein